MQSIPDLIEHAIATGDADSLRRDDMCKVSFEFLVYLMKQARLRAFQQTGNRRIYKCWRQQTWDDCLVIDDFGCGPEAFFYYNVRLKGSEGRTTHMLRCPIPVSQLTGYYQRNDTNEACNRLQQRKAA